MTNKNDIVTVRFEKLGINGEGVATLGDGLKLFVPFVLPGEIAEVKILAVKKNLAFGKVLKVLSPSADRTEPKCPVFGKCGGCQLQHLSYHRQVEWKRAAVRETLAHVGKIAAQVDDTVTCGREYGYRNKIQLPICYQNERNVIGFYRENSHDAVDICTCPLHPQWASDLIEALRAYLAQGSLRGYDETRKAGDVRHAVARHLGGKLSVCIVTPKEKLPRAELLQKELAKRFEHFSLHYNVNRADTNVILGEKTVTVFGDERLKFEWKGLNVSLAVPSFLQVNSDVASALYDDAIKAAAVTQSDVVIDAYSGSGIMSSLFARKAKHVYGVEICAPAVSDADELARANGIENLTNLLGDCAAIVPRLARDVRAGRAVGLREPVLPESLVVVLDPPRKGCDRAVLDAVKIAAPDRLIYISCNPATLARDLNILTDAGQSLRESSSYDGVKTPVPPTVLSIATASPATFASYNVERVTPYDMFAQSSHVETLVVLRKNSESAF